MNEQEAIRVLKEAKDSTQEEYDVAFDMAIKALEKQMPKKVRMYSDNDISCPACGSKLRNYEGIRNPYCKFCGQAIER